MHTHNDPLPHLNWHPNLPVPNLRGGHSRFIRKQARYLIKLCSQRKLQSGKKDRFDNLQAVAVLIHRSINAKFSWRQPKNCHPSPLHHSLVLVRIFEHLQHQTFTHFPGKWDGGDTFVFLPGKDSFSLLLSCSTGWRVRCRPPRRAGSWGRGWPSRPWGTSSGCTGPCSPASTSSCLEERNKINLSLSWYPVSSDHPYKSLSFHYKDACHRRGRGSPLN